MYANADSVRGLCRNRTTAIADAEIQAVATSVDAEIDGRLGAFFSWPNDPQGRAINAPPPALVVAAANYLTASLIESQSFAQNEAGQAVANPYGRMLERRGNAILDRIESGELLVKELRRADQILTTGAPVAFAPVSGLRTSGPRRSRR